MKADSAELYHWLEKKAVLTHSPASNATACLKHQHLPASFHEFSSAGESSDASTDHHHVMQRQIIGQHGPVRHEQIGPFKAAWAIVGATANTGRQTLI